MSDHDAEFTLIKTKGGLRHWFNSNGGRSRYLKVSLVKWGVVNLLHIALPLERIALNPLS